MKVSSVYEKEYRHWIEDGRFEPTYSDCFQHFPEALRKENPALVGGELDVVANCYYMRGAVLLLDNDLGGWQDIQCGYWASLYALRFHHKAATLPAWSEGRPFLPVKETAAVLTLGLAKLFRQEADVLWLRSLLGTNFDIREVLGDRIKSGRKILLSILDQNSVFSYEELLRDRTECCQKREAWPTRPTGIRPFGVIDIELILRFPQNASFHYLESMGFNPTDDQLLLKSVTTYHCWYE